MEFDVKLALLKCNLFENMSEEEVTLFLDNNYRTEQYSKGDIFAIAGDEVNHLMIVLQGELIARMVSDSGKYVQIDRIGAGKVVAPAMIFASNNVFPVNVIPESDDVVVLFMHKQTLVKAMQNSEQLLFNFIRAISDIHYFLSRKIHSLSLKSIRGKIAEFIISESKRKGDAKSISLDLTRQELADKFAVSRQSLIRSLSEMEQDGLFKIEGRKITIPDRAKLMFEE